MHAIMGSPVRDDDDYDSDTFMPVAPKKSPYAELGKQAIPSMLARAEADRRES